jgi:hypothetical protein
MSTILFTETETAAFERALAPLDAGFSSFAERYRCRYIASAGKGWPGRTARCRRFFRTFRLRILLNPNFLQDRLSYFVIAAQWSIEFGELLTRNLRYQVVARFEQQELIHNPAGVLNAAQKAFERELGRGH